MPNPPTNLSLRGFARLLGVDEAAIRKGIHTGRLAASVVYVKGRPKIGDLERAREEWVENADPGRRFAAGQRLELPSLPSSAALAAAWNRYVDTMEHVEAGLVDVFAAHCRALGYDPEADAPVPAAGLEVWRQLGAAERAAREAFRGLAEALEAAGVGITFAPSARRQP